MKIIIHRYNSICEPDFIEAFQTLGIEVIEDREEMTRKSIPTQERVETIGRLILEQRPLFVFTINFFPYISLVCERLKVPYVCVSVDCPVSEIYNNEIRNGCNRVFLFDYQQFESVHEENPACIYHLPLGVNVERIDRTIGDYPGFLEKTKQEDRYRYDISFVGSLYTEKDPYAALPLSPRDRGYFDGLIAAQMQLPGLELLDETVGEREAEIMKAADSNFFSSALSIKNMDHFTVVNQYLGHHISALERLKLMEILPKYLPEARTHLFTLSDGSGLKGVKCHGGVSSLYEMPEVFRRSRINLNHTMRPIRTGLPQRIWDILGCGGFCLTNAQAEIPEFLEVGKHLETYETWGELVEKANYYLTHEEEREAIARAGYEEVKARHTVMHRVSEMIRIILGTME